MLPVDKTGIRLQTLRSIFELGLLAYLRLSTDVDVAGTWEAVRKNHCKYFFKGS